MDRTQEPENILRSDLKHQKGPTSGVFVSRGGFKLEHAIKTFGVDVKEKTVLDVGSSTGGFVDCLLQHGAKKVYALDTAYGEFAWKLRNDSRVVVMERTNVLHVTELPGPTPDSANLTPAPLPEGEGEYGYQKTDPKTWYLLQEAVLEMRKNPTPAEEILWEALREITGPSRVQTSSPDPFPEGEGETSGIQLSLGGRVGVRFRRQHIIGKFIVDFVCLQNKLVIEVDGDIHDYQKADDDLRTEYLMGLGYTIARFSNQEVLDNLSKVLKEIESRIHAPSLSGRGKGGEVVDLVTIDASWTKLELILPVVQKFLKPEGKIIALIKPHYQAEKSDLKKGVLAEDKVSEVVNNVLEKVKALGWNVEAQTESPILGGAGNKEFLVLLSRDD